MGAHLQAILSPSGKDKLMLFLTVLVFHSTHYAFHIVDVPLSVSPNSIVSMFVVCPVIAMD